MTLDEAIQQMKVYFDQYGWPLDVDYNKLNNRASLSSETYEPGWTVVKIERHRSILSATYTKGLPMSAFQTYWMRYALNPATGEVRELAEEAGPLVIDVSALVDEELENGFGLKIEPSGNGKYQVYDNVVGKRAQEVSNVEETIAFALADMQGWSNYFKESLQREEGIAAEEIDQWVSEHEKYLQAQITEKAQQVWEEREEL
jgi:hypothetical protein